MRTLLRLLRLTPVALFGSACLDFGIGLTGPIWGPSGGGPNFPPGSFFTIISTERAVQVGDTLRLLLLDGGTPLWFSSDTSVATVSGDATEGRVVGRSNGSAIVTVQAHGRAITRRIDVVAALCQRQEPARILSFGADTTLTLDESDCALGYDERFQWPQLPEGPAHPSLRAEALRIDLSDSTLLRIDASSATLRPLLALADSQGRAIGGRLNPSNAVYFARRLPPGRYSIWIASDTYRPSGDLQLQVRSVAGCGDASVVPRTLTLGAWQLDTLDATSCHSDWGEVQQPWRVTLPAAGWYRTTIEALSGDPHDFPYLLHAGSALGNVSSWFEAGTYTLLATNGIDGPYRLRMVACANAESCPP